MAPSPKFQPGHQTNFKHGGEKALQATRRGFPISAEIAAREAEAMAEFERIGRLGVVTLWIARFQTLATLFYEHAITCFETGDIDGAHAAVKRAGWLGGKVVTALNVHREEEKAQGDGRILDYETVLAARKDGDGGS